MLELVYAHAKDTGVISMDTEWQPEYSSHEHNKVALLQLGIRNDVFLLQLVHMNQPLPEVLGRLLSDPNVVKVGCSIKTDCKVRIGVHMRERHAEAKTDSLPALHVIRWPSFWLQRLLADYGLETLSSLDIREAAQVG